MTATPAAHAPDKPAPSPAGRIEDYEAFPAYQQTYLLSYVQIADTKAAVFLAITSGALAFIASHFGVAWLEQHTFGGHYILLTLSTLLLSISAIQAVATVAPKMRDITNPLHFRAVAAMHSEEDYVRDVMHTSPEDLLRHQIASCYQLAKVCARKYRLLHRCLAFGAAGYVVFVAALFWRV